MRRSCTNQLVHCVLSGFFSAVIALIAPAAVIAQEIVSASPDVTIDLGGGVVATDEDIAIDNQLSIVLLENLGVLPHASEVIALGLDVNGDRIISFETATALSGGVVARPGDVLRYDGTAYSIEFDASAAGLPGGVATDATSLSANGLILSFDTTVDLGGGLIVADEDLVDWNGSSFGLVFDGSAVGIDSSLDVDAAQNLGGGKFYLSFDTTGEIADLVFDDEDVLYFDGSAWSLAFDADAANASWAAADLNAVMVPEPGRLGLLGTGGMLLLVFAHLRQSHQRWANRAIPCATCLPQRKLMR
jgi:hypothetical protein